ncbi:MAG TPA: sodium-translocating pyrophosphatase [Egibacteraceae bacterium]|nr:sodium-translocating pyrophosphatase [Egibacteraceae bacterium]
MNDATSLVSLATAVAGLALAGYFFGAVRRADPGNERMVELMLAIQSGARAFIRREYTWIAGFVVLMAVLIYAFLDYGRPWGALAYLGGAVMSGLAGVIGMTIATEANARTTQAARSGSQTALPLAFRGGAVMGFSVAGLALLGLSAAYVLFVQVLEAFRPYQVVTAFGLGASSIALFSRVGGGIYTKAADVGADLFESYAGSIIAPIALAAFAFVGQPDFQVRAILFPLAIGAVGMVASIVGAFFVKSKPQASGKALARSLHRGTNVAAGLTIVAVFAAGYLFFDGLDEVARWWGLPLAAVVGLLVGSAIGSVSEYYTSARFPPVRRIAAASRTGTATNVLEGISAGMLSVASAVVLVVVAVAAAFAAGEHALPGVANTGVYGIALAAIGMLATTGVVVAVDAYGPIADNAGGIAEMAGLPSEVRVVTDELDALGNTTAAVAKGFAIGSAAITALALFKAFEQAVGGAGGQISLDVGRVDVFVGLFLGAMLPFLFAALTIQAVGRAANKMIAEVRRQFAEIPGLRAGDPGARPQYARCVDISTTAALREMVLPGTLAVAAPLAIGLLSVNALGGFLAGALVTGFALAIYMANAGGAWDNAKKYIEAGHLGGKGGEPHKAAVVGDTVGDPFKDTAGPSMNILIKVMTIVSLIFASAFV